MIIAVALFALLVCTNTCSAAIKGGRIIQEPAVIQEVAQPHFHLGKGNGGGALHHAAIVNDPISGPVVVEKVSRVGGIKGAGLGADSAQIALSDGLFGRRVYRTGPATYPFGLTGLDYYSYPNSLLTAPRLLRHKTVAAPNLSGLRPIGLSSGVKGGIIADPISQFSVGDAQVKTAVFGARNLYRSGLSDIPFGLTGLDYYSYPKNLLLHRQIDTGFGIGQTKILAGGSAFTAGDSQVRGPVVVSHAPVAAPLGQEKVTVVETNPFDGAQKVTTIHNAPAVIPQQVSVLDDGIGALGDGFGQRRVTKGGRIILGAGPGMGGLRRVRVRPVVAAQPAAVVVHETSGLAPAIGGFGQRQVAITKTAPAPIVPAPVVAAPPRILQAPVVAAPPRLLQAPVVAAAPRLVQAPVAQVRVAPAPVVAAPAPVFAAPAPVQIVQAPVQRPVITRRPGEVFLSQVQRPQIIERPAIAPVAPILGGGNIQFALGGTQLIGGPIVAPAPRPVVVAQAPAFAAPRPVVVAPRPAVVAQRPVVVEQAPVVAAPRPVVVAQAPAFAAPRPLVVAQRPAVVAQAPIVAAPRPVIVEQRPAVVAQAPIIAAPRPAVFAQRPAVIAQAPIAAAPRPVIVEQRPAVVAQAPIVAAPRPVLLAQRPAVVAQRPVVVEQAPVITAQRPVVVAAPRPVAFAQRPVVVEQRPQVISQVKGGVINNNILARRIPQMVYVDGGNRFLGIDIIGGYRVGDPRFGYAQLPYTGAGRFTTLGRLSQAQIPIQSSIEAGPTLFAPEPSPILASLTKAPVLSVSAPVAKTVARAAAPFGFSPITKTAPSVVTQEEVVGPLGDRQVVTTVTESDANRLKGGSIVASPLGFAAVGQPATKTITQEEVVGPLGDPQIVTTVTKTEPTGIVAGPSKIGGLATGGFAAIGRAPAKTITQEEVVGPLGDRQVVTTVTESDAHRLKGGKIGGPIVSSPLGFAAVGQPATKTITQEEVVGPLGEPQVLTTVTKTEPSAIVAGPSKIGGLATGGFAAIGRAPAKTITQEEVVGPAGDRQVLTTVTETDGARLVGGKIGGPVVSGPLGLTAVGHGATKRITQEEVVGPLGDSQVVTTVTKTQQAPISSIVQQEEVLSPVPAFRTTSHLTQEIAQDPIETAITQTKLASPLSQALVDPLGSGQTQVAIDSFSDPSAITQVKETTFADPLTGSVNKVTEVSKSSVADSIVQQNIADTVVQENISPVFGGGLRFSPRLTFLSQHPYDVPDSGILRSILTRPVVQQQQELEQILVK